MKSANYTFLALLAILFLASCSEDDIATEVSVFTEEVVFSSGERVILSGRVLAQGEIAVTDHGFQIAEDENFGSPITISLGEKTIPGRFIGEYESLTISLDYYCRSFIVENGETTFGNVLPFATLSPIAIDFSPKEGGTNTKVTIEGRNLTADTKVFWNGQPINPNSISDETFVEISAPSLSDDPNIEIEIESQRSRLQLENTFDYIIGVWTEEGPLDDDSKNTEHIYFEEGDKIIYGLGLAQGDITNAIQILDKNSLQRSTTFFPGQPIVGACFHSGYFGGGSTQKVFANDLSLELTNAFWKYENQNFIQLADMPESLHKAIALRVDDKLYVYGGENASRMMNDRIFIYNINSNEWTTSSVAPIRSINEYPAFHLGGFNYIINEEGELWRHDYLNDEWQQMSDFPTTPKVDGISIVLNDKAYVGMQDINRRVYVYRPDSDTWRSKELLPEINPFNTLMGWKNNDKLFYARTPLNQVNNRVLWSLSPDEF